MNEIKKKHLTELNEEDKRLKNATEEATKLLKALKQYKGNTINKRFNKEAGFIENNGYRDIIQFKLEKHRYDWKDEFQIYITNYEYIETTTRNRKEVIEKTEEFIKNKKEQIKRNINSIEKLKNTDIDKAIEEIKEVYKRNIEYNYVWWDILESLRFFDNK
jgi:glycyl-tRNA synthetase (class II)